MPLKRNVSTLKSLFHFSLFKIWQIEYLFIWPAIEIVRLLRSSANVYWITGRIKPSKSSVPCENDANNLADNKAKASGYNYWGTDISFTMIYLISLSAFDESTALFPDLYCVGN